MQNSKLMILKGDKYENFYERESIADSVYWVTELETFGDRSMLSTEEGTIWLSETFLVSYYIF